MDNNSSEWNRYAIGFAEVYELFKYAEEEFLEKIPSKFKNFISENRDTLHSFKFDPEKPIEEQKLTDATKEIISVIYFNCFCTKEEKEQILREERIRVNAKEKELHDKYNPDNIFKNNIYDNVQNVEELSASEQNGLIDASRLIWYKKIYFKILNFVNRFRRSIS